MKRIGLLMALVLVVAMATPALAGGAECRAKAEAAAAAKHTAHADANGKAEGVHSKPKTRAEIEASLRGRGWVGIELERDEETGRPVVTKVVPASPAVYAGFQEGDILLAVDGVELDPKKGDCVSSCMAKLRPGQRVKYTVERDGSTRNLRTTLARMPDTVINQVANWMIENQEQAVEIARGENGVPAKADDKN